MWTERRKKEVKDERYQISLARRACVDGMSRERALFETYWSQDQVIALPHAVQCKKKKKKRQERDRTYVQPHGSMR